ncbi:transcriptional regulator, TetR family [marine gamma proteobacterium HTCC2148]|nr:transcriptional regulator, TetR family [marine gamma proteobacterium HTCC2148]
MKTLPTQKRALIKRQSLINAAKGEFSNNGFEVATAKTIAAAAAVATGTFYRHFDNKNEILRVIASTRFDELHQRIKRLELKTINRTQSPSLNTEAHLLETLMFVHQFHAQDPELHQVLEQRRALDPKLKTIMDQGEYVLRKRVLTFVNTFNISNPELVAENLFAMAEGLVHRLVFYPTGYDATGSNLKQGLEIGAKMLASYLIQNQVNATTNSTS